MSQSWLKLVNWFLLRADGCLSHLRVFRTGHTKSLKRLIARTSGPRCNIQLQTSFFKLKDSFTLVWSDLCITNSYKDREEGISRRSCNQSK